MDERVDLLATIGSLYVALKNAKAEVLLLKQRLAEAEKGKQPAEVT